MQRNIALVAMTLLLIGCARNLSPDIPSVTATSILQSNDDEDAWNIYTPDPAHPWNLVFRQFYQRISTNGDEYGADELDPLLWFDTTYLLTGDSHQQAIQVLDEFLSTHAEDLIHDPLKRAMFQRDVWAVFDWLASQSEPSSTERQALKARLALIIRRVALSKEEILSLPENYSLEIEAGIYPTTPPDDHPDMAFLPSDIFEPDSAWIPMGRPGGPIAMTHTESFPFFGRSVFLVYVRSPQGRTGTLDFIESMNTEENPVTDIGTEVALVRRMLLIDDQGEMMLSPLVESIQIRYFAPEQHFHEFELNRINLLNGEADSLILKTDLFMLFMSHGDVFEADHGPELKARIPSICAACHFEYPPVPNSGNTHSIISYSRNPFSLSNDERPILIASSVTDEAEKIIKWKHNHETWTALQVLWNQSNP